MSIAEKTMHKGLDLPSRVCLIIPPSLFLLDERVFMSLGILKVAAALEQKNINVDVLDLSGVSNFLDAISDYVRFNSDVSYFGLTATTPQLPSAKKIADVIRILNGNAKIILGGPHITLVNAACKYERSKGIYDGRAMKAISLAQSIFDILICGDGERSIFIALNKNAPRIIDADDRHSSLFLSNKDLDEQVFPARHLVDASSYNYSIDGIPATSLITQLGCPFNCGFCGGRSSPMLRNIRTRSPDNIIVEMIHLYRSYGYRGFMFYDDELNVNKRIIELMKLIIRAQRDLGVEWKLRGFVKSELFTDEQAAIMYEAGFRWLLIGFESGSPEILKTINKKATQEDNTRCVDMAKKNGLKIKALMSVGHPGETEETIFETKKWLLEVKPHDFDVTVITCYPGTPYYDQAVSDVNQDGVWVYTHKETGSKLYQIEVDYTKIADYYKGNPDGGYTSYVFTDDISRERIVELRNNLEREVRLRLNIPFNQGAPSIIYEHSMGQQGVFPKVILRR